MIQRRASDRPLSEGRAVKTGWGATALMVGLGVALGTGAGIGARNYLSQQAMAAPLPEVTVVHAQPVMTAGPSDNPPSGASVVVPDHILLQVPYTTQAPLVNWAQHQESCEEATLTMLSSYWTKDRSVVIDPYAADASIAALVRWQVQNWGSEDDLTDRRMGELAKGYYGYGYKIVPNDPQDIREQLAAGRPLIASVRTHGLGNPNYPGYRNHYEQTGWSVPHFVLVIGYDGDGVWLNDAGISKGLGYHITFGQLYHAIDSLDQHHPALNEGQVLLVAAPQFDPKPHQAIYWVE